jgi:hypothetical protein
MSVKGPVIVVTVLILLVGSIVYLAQSVEPNVETKVDVLDTRKLR